MKCACWSSWSRGCTHTPLSRTGNSGRETNAFSGQRRIEELHAAALPAEETGTYANLMKPMDLKLPRRQTFQPSPGEAPVQAACAAPATTKSADGSGCALSRAFQPRMPMRRIDKGIFMQSTILLIEDESPNRAIVKRVLHHMPLTFLEAENVQQALELSGTGPVDLVLLDIGLPMADGYTFLERFRADAVNQAIPVCVMTGRTEDRHRRKAIEMGADDFIVKPVDNVELETRVKSLLRIREYQKRLLDANATLEGRVQERTAYLRAVLDELEHAWGENTLAYREMVMRLALAAEYKDKVTAAHIERMSHYSALLARRCGWSGEETVLLLEAAKMHDIGKIGIPDAILHKQERLTAPEYAVIKQHPQIGAAILAGSKSRLLQLAEH